MANSLHGRRVLVSGAGVAGPALAHWLSRHGAETTVVEAAPTLRTSGFAVDFRGPTHHAVLARMGVLDDLRTVRTNGGAMVWVDEHDRELFRLPEEFAGGDIEVLRRDLSRVLHDHSADHADYVFGDTITDLAETADGVHVDFARSASRTFDYVVGTDGLHSAVRRIAFGEESRYVKHLGYYLAGWDVPNDLGAGPTAHHYNVPGRMASIKADLRDPTRAGALVVFAAPRLDVGWRDVEAQKRIVADTFADLGWHTTTLLAGLADADDLYFDSISRVSVPRWHSGRVALLGDAAWGVTLGGMGVGTGVVGAYVLAGELAAAGGDHRAGFAAYENRMRGYAAKWQKSANPGQFLAPSTALRLRLRNAMFRSNLVQRMLIASTKSFATDIALPDYTMSLA
ncbi:MAG TPA: FAD-dependent monooxygenase [Pseudonocardiaceae bacterium]|nr:FAD-dependent monooxygenase [Pseudonocardiaceae bacterium]